MEFETLLDIIGQQPVFEPGLLLAGDVDPHNVRRQLTRWTASGRLHQLRRGVYALAEPYAKARPHPFAVANLLQRPSYVSLQAALAHYGMIPEYAAVTTSVSTGRTRQWETPLGIYRYRHVKRKWFRGYGEIDLGQGQRALVASPAKALLDLVYLTPGGDDPVYLDELRLQGLDRLDLAALRALAAGSPKLVRASERIAAMAQEREDGDVL